MGVEAARIMKPVHSGPLEVNRGPNAAPAADHGACFAQDRAAVVTTAILQIVHGVLTAWPHREHADLSSVRDAIEPLLRDEFDAHARASVAEIRLDDE